MRRAGVAVFDRGWRRQLFVADLRGRGLVDLVDGGNDFLERSVVERGYRTFECLQPAPPGNCLSPYTSNASPCGMDVQCTAGMDGRCIVDFLSGVEECECTYDTCMHDSDCVAGDTCECHGSPYALGGNTCVPGNCRVDSDCCDGGYCSPARSLGCSGVVGYFCHTPQDTCVDDSDCPSDAGLQPQICSYSTSRGYWECMYREGCY